MNKSQKKHKRELKRKALRSEKRKRKIFSKPKKSKISGKQGIAHSVNSDSIKPNAEFNRAAWGTINVEEN